MPGETPSRQKRGSLPNLDPHDLGPTFGDSELRFLEAICLSANLSFLAVGK
jgi:hypothetical protein